MKTEKCSRKNHQFRVHKIDDSFCDPKALVFGFQSCSARDGLRLIIMRIRFRASDCGLVAKMNIIGAKSKQASCAEMVLGSFVFL